MLTLSEPQFEAHPICLLTQWGLTLFSYYSWLHNFPWSPVNSQILTRPPVRPGFNPGCLAYSLRMSCQLSWAIPLLPSPPCAGSYRSPASPPSLPSLLTLTGWSLPQGVGWGASSSCLPLSWSRWHWPPRIYDPGWFSKYFLLATRELRWMLLLLVVWPAKLTTEHNTISLGK